jgi:hypothetical protein
VGVQRQVSHAFAVLKFISMYILILRNNTYININIKKETEMPFVENTKIYAMNRLERNIIIGSLLGDGSLALYGRSKNAYYREHGCTRQVPYRQWKADKLKNLDFKLLTT